VGDANRWWTVRVVVPAPDAEAAVAVLWSAGVAGIEERPGGDAPTGERHLLAGVEGAAVDAVLDALGARWEVEVLPVAGDEWLDEWRRWARPWRAGRRFVVVPSWQEPPPWAGDDDVVLAIDPGRAFGSGAHATTRLCLAVLEDRVAPGARVVDVGCGSGVLAVAAARSGAAHVEAVDVDPEAVRVTAVNAARNGVADRVRASSSGVDELTATADVVVANIGASVLVALAPALVRATAQGGSLVLSGLLSDQLGGVATAFAAAGAAPVDDGVEGEWHVLVLEHRPSRGGSGPRARR
jgi:ribosomal protein L11 methyltransferase